MMAERGVELSHTTILRWVIRYVAEFAKRWDCFARRIGSSWRVDDTYVCIRRNWHYLYRAVDKHGMTVDFLLRPDRGIEVAQAPQSAGNPSAACTAQCHARWTRAEPSRTMAAAARTSVLAKCPGEKLPVPQ
jgi:hypothetical protein